MKRVSRTRSGSSSGTRGGAKSFDTFTALYRLTDCGTAWAERIPLQAQFHVRLNVFGVQANTVGEASKTLTLCNKAAHQEPQEPAYWDQRVRDGRVGGGLGAPTCLWGGHPISDSLRRGMGGPLSGEGGGQMR